MARRVRDAAELERQKLARQRFRSLIRSVMYNRIWLNDAEDQQKISMNVKRNVAMLVRRKHKIGVLTMAEKGLIRTPHSLRSIEDRKQLLKLVTGMQCFSKLPPQVRARLIPVIKFLYLSNGRVIIKEGGFADTIYFILYGEVEASRKVFDPIKGEYTDKVEFIYGPGDCIGDIEMIENCPRKHTYTATSVVEMLVVFGYDFDEILRTEMTKQWFEKQAALKTLGYFEHFNEEQNINANKLSVLREFDALETIYYEDKGEASYAYFVLSGECMILQSLQLKVKEKWGIKCYELAEISKVKKHDKFSRKNAMKDLKEHEKVARKSYDIDQLLESDEEYDTELYRIKQALKAMDIKTIEISCGTRKASEPIIEEAASEHSIPRKSVDSKEDEFFKMHFESPRSRETEDFEGVEEHSSTALLHTRLMQDQEKQEKQAENQTKDAKTPAKDSVQEQPNTETNEENKEEKTAAVEEFKSQERESQEVKINEIPNLDHTETQNETAEGPGSNKASEGSVLSVISKKASSQSLTSKKPPPFTMETRFIDVGTLTFGGIFGLGEKFEDRVIMARTKVQCLLMPRFWLFEKEQNPGRIWQRRRFVIHTGIPSREQLYHDFLSTRKWQKYKNNFISSILDSTSNQNETHIEDIPMMFHIINPVEE